MLDEIWVKVVLTIIGIVTTGSCGYLSAKLKEFKNKMKSKEENENIQNVAIRTILKSQLTKTYFVYSELKQIPDYVYQDFLDMLKVYESFGGNGFVHTLAKKMENWEITKTDIL
jgi:hypothetical protein